MSHLSLSRNLAWGRRNARTSVADRWVLFGGGTRIPATGGPDVCGTLERSAVVDIVDTRTGEWSTECLEQGRTTMNAARYS
jgi:hypothetical protein